MGVCLFVLEMHTWLNKLALKLILAVDLMCILCPHDFLSAFVPYLGTDEAFPFR